MDLAERIIDFMKHYFPWEMDSEAEMVLAETKGMIARKDVDHIIEFLSDADDIEEVETLVAELKSLKKINTDDLGVYIEWINHGGMINYMNGLYIMADGEWLDICREHNIDNTEAAQRSFCKSALENANIPESLIIKGISW